MSSAVEAFFFLARGSRVGRVANRQLSLLQQQQRVFVELRFCSSCTDNTETILLCAALAYVKIPSRSCLFIGSMTNPHFEPRHLAGGVPAFWAVVSPNVL